MGETDENKVPTLEELYKSDANLQSIYDLKDGQLVVKADRVNDVTGQQDPLLKQALEPLDQAKKSFGEMVDGMVTESQAYDKKAEKIEKNNDRVQLFGGIAEAASALTNLIGTTQGAASQKWETPQQKWAERADTFRREKEARQKNYRDQIKALNQAKSQIDIKRASVISAFNNQKEATARTNARIQAAANVAIAKVQEATKVKLAKNGADGLKTIANNANKLLLGIIREYGDMGTMPTEANIAAWSELAYNAALSAYKNDHPEDFEGDALKDKFGL